MHRKINVSLSHRCLSLSLSVPLSLKSITINFKKMLSLACQGLKSYEALIFCRLRVNDHQGERLGSGQWSVRREKKKQDCFKTITRIMRTPSFKSSTHFPSTHFTQKRVPSGLAVFCRCPFQCSPVFLLVLILVAKRVSMAKTHQLSEDSIQ